MWKVKVLFSDNHAEEYMCNSRIVAHMYIEEYCAMPDVYGVELYRLVSGTWVMFKEGSK